MPLSVSGAESPSNTEAYLHATIDQRHTQERQNRQTGQRSDSIGRTVLQTVAQKSFEKYNSVLLSEALAHNEAIKTHSSTAPEQTIICG